VLLCWNQSTTSNNVLMKPSNTSLGLATALAIALLPVPFAQAATGQVNESYLLNPDGRVRIENVNGSIEIRAWDGVGVKLEAIKKGRTQEIVDGIQILTESTPDQLAIKTELAQVKRGWFRRTTTEGQVSYTLHVPAGARIEKAASVNGDITLQGIQGEVRASTVNGSIRGGKLAGATDVNTVNGSINLDQRALPAGNHLKARTVNGSIEVRLPASTGGSLSASTVNGSIRSDIMPSNVTRQKRNKLEARIGEGDSKILLSTVNGAIRILDSRNEQTAAR
jgi:DUF4097 and DUF4098 domain-containing protein YvlB